MFLTLKDFLMPLCKPFLLVSLSLPFVPTHLLICFKPQTDSKF